MPAALVPAGQPAATHEVPNQPPPLVDYDAAAIDTALNNSLDALGASSVATDLTELGALVGDPQVQRWAVEANTTTPVLRTHDRFGHRIDEVEFHPSWHALMDVAVSYGLHAAGGQTHVPTPICAAPPGSTCGARPRPDTVARSR